MSMTPAKLRIKRVFLAGADPSLDDDSVADPRREVGDDWVNEATGAVYTCWDNSPGAAQWVETDGSGGSGGSLSDGDHGDIVVSGGGTALDFDSSVITTAARTVLDDASVAAMLATLGGVPTTRTVSTTAPLLGGGALSGNLTLSVDVDGSTVVVSAGTLAVGAIPESSVTGLTTDLAAKVPTTRTVSTTSPLSGGGALSGDLTLSVGDASSGAKGVVKLAGQLGGTATSPTVTGLTETSGPTALALGSIPDGYFLKRSGSTVIGSTGSLITATNKRYDPDLPYASATFITPTQEFCTAQSQGGWTNSWDLGTISPSVSIGPGGLEITTTATSAALGGVYHSTFPAGDFCVALKYSAIGGGTGAGVGLGFMQGIGSTDDVYFVGSYCAGYGSADLRLWLSAFTAYNVPGSDLVFLQVGSPMYALVRYQASGHKVTTWMGPSPDDLRVVHLDFTLANAATKLGLLVRGVSGATRYTRGLVQFVRVIADTYDGSGGTVPPRLMGALVADY